MVVQDEINIQESRINQKAKNTMSVMLCTGTTCVRKTPAQFLEQFHLILQVCIYLLSVFQSHTHLKILKLILVTLLTLLKYPPIKSYLNQWFQVSQLLKYDGNTVIKQRFFKAMLWWKGGHPQIALYEAYVHQ